MQNEFVNVNNQEVAVKVWNDQRVVTFKDIDLVHQRPEGTASRNFRGNRQRFIKGEDFFKISQPDEIRRLGIVRPQGGTPSDVTLITESGYLMLVKSFTDDLAWEVQRQLVNNYFKKQPQPSIIYQYPVSAATFESIANLGRLCERAMRKQGSFPHEITLMIQGLCHQGGVSLPECFVKIPDYEQMVMVSGTNQNMFLR